MSRPKLVLTTEDLLLLFNVLKGLDPEQYVDEVKGLLYRIRALKVGDTVKVLP